MPSRLVGAPANAVSGVVNGRTVIVRDPILSGLGTGGANGRIDDRICPSKECRRLHPSILGWSRG
jgi:hypothetical protein